jgi:hypothetical protein
MLWLVVSNERWKAINPDKAVPKIPDILILPVFGFS